MPNPHPGGPHPLLRLAPWADLAAKIMAAIAAGLAVWGQLG